MKKAVFLLFCVCLVLGGCTNEQGTPAGGNTVDVVMNDAQPLPTTINIKGFNGVDYEMIVKDVVIREMTNIEKEKPWQNTEDLSHIAILKYSSKSLSSYSANNRVDLNGDEFALVIEHRSFREKSNLIPLDASEYTTEAYNEGYYQGYIILLINKETAESPYLQLRYIPKGTTTAEYFNLK
ncbi:MAG: hypothetical protein LBB49_00875 [Gracilibacteraceae bacterium]|nr:hypothetical protein [Gracilibacteraceae bacterium]